MLAKLKYPLRELFEKALSGSYSDAQLNELLRICLTTGRQLVRRKIASGKLRLQDLRLNENDITCDCVADLFTRDDEGRLTEFARFIQSQGIVLSDLSEEMLFVHLRRLVFGTVSNSLFRVYNEIDPTAGKIIRNLKIAVGKSTRCRIVTVFDEQYIEVNTNEPLANCRSINAEELDDEVQRIAATVNDIPALLDSVIEFLLEQTMFRRRVKVTALALAAKRSFERFSSAGRELQVYPDTSLLQYDVRKIITESCKETDIEMRLRYVLKGKVDNATFDKYINALNDFLCAEYLLGFDGDSSAYRCFLNHNPAVPQQEYLNHHKAIFEYLIRLTRERALRRLKTL